MTQRINDLVRQLAEEFHDLPRSAPFGALDLRRLFAQYQLPGGYGRRQVHKETVKREAATC